LKDDFVISVHALDRFEERFPEDWTNDGDTGLLIYQEVIDAINGGRVGSVAPLELADNDLSQWVARKSRIAWVPNKSRGYVIVDDSGEMMVATVLVGKTSEEARRKLYGTKGSSPVQARTKKDGQT
jgi:hypothetical protein